jgi:fibronectin-binding autotransporter adhesin
LLGESRIAVRCLPFAKVFPVKKNDCGTFEDSIGNRVRWAFCTSGSRGCRSANVVGDRIRLSRGRAKTGGVVLMSLGICGDGRSSCRCGLGLLVGMLAASVSVEALALNGSWDVDASGTWSNTANWASGVIGTGNGFTATFANDITADRTVTLDSTRAVGSLVFGDSDPTSAASWVVARSASENFTLNNSTSSTSFITVNSLGTNATATISLLVGSGANAPLIEKNGVGTLVFTGNNPFAAKLAVTAGSLQVSADNQLGGTGSFATDRITLSGGGTLKTTAGFTLNSNRGITVGAGGGVLNLTGGNLTTAIPFTGAGETLTVTGTSGMSASNASGTPSSVNWDFAGNSGLRYFFNGSNAIGTGSIQIGSGIRFTTQNTAVTSGQVTNAVTLAAGAGITARNSGGSVEYTNVTFPSSGTVVFNKDDALTAALTISSGGALAGDLSVDTSQQATNAVGDVTLSGIFTGVGGVTKIGTGASGKLILGGANTYNGNTTISTGTLALGASGSIASSPAIVVGDGATFDVTSVAGFAVGASQELAGSGTVTGAVAANGTISPGVTGVASGVGTISFANDLALAGGSILGLQLDGTDFTVGGSVNDLISASSNLTLDGTLNVTALNSFASATVGNTWRLFNYTGTLTDNGLTLGSMPSLGSGLTFSIDTSAANQVNLVVVPEPGGTYIIAVGLTGLAAVRRRRSGRWPEKIWPGRRDFRAARS